MTKYFSEKEVNRPPHLGGGKWKLKNLNEITIFFGKNGSGKSQLLRSLRDSNPPSYHYSSPERVGNIVHNATFMEDQLIPKKRGNRRTSNVGQNFREEAMSRIRAVATKISNQTRRSKKAENDSEEYDLILDEIEASLNFLLPDFSFKITGDSPPFIIKRTIDNTPVIDVDSLSSGETEILTLSIDLLTMSALLKLEKQTPRVLLVDEPDTHLHPDLQQQFGLFLVKLSTKYEIQLFIATHSTTLLSALGFHGGDKTSLIYLNNSVVEQKAEKFDKKLQELSTCLGGHALMGPLFGAPLLLVEGDDDNKIWSQVPRYNQINIAVIPCDCATEVKKYQKTLEQIFSSLRTDQTDPVGFALLDGDQTLPNENSHPQKNIKFIQLVCRESENLYLSDDVLRLFDLDWEAAKQKIKSESHHFPNRKEKLDQCDTWDRKTVDLKNLITALYMILDSKRHPWTVRVAKCLGKRRPEGQLAEFLGESLIVSLWGAAPEPQTEIPDSNDEES